MSAKLSRQGTEVVPRPGLYIPPRCPFPVTSGPLGPASDPSIIHHPDRSGAPSSRKRIHARCIGTGKITSIVSTQSRWVMETLPPWYHTWTRRSQFVEYYSGTYPRRRPCVKRRNHHPHPCAGGRECDSPCAGRRRRLGCLPGQCGIKGGRLPLHCEV